MFFSCQKKFLCTDCEVNQPPIGNAGPDQIIILPKDSIFLDGSNSSDADGKIISYKWAKIEGPISSNIRKPDSSKTLVKTLVAGVYKFELTVKDNGELSAKDTVQIMVNDPAVNQPPIACAGPNLLITLPVNTVILDGSCSTDPDNNITSYAWTKISGPSSFNITNAVQTSVTSLTEGTYLFELKVTDAGGLFSKDTVRIIVNEVLPPPPPISDSLGRIIFWTKLAVNDDRLASIINVSIGTQTKIITWYYSGTPTSCLDGRIVFHNEGIFDLAPGIYSWKANYYNYKDSGTVSIVRGVCDLREIIFK